MRSLFQLCPSIGSSSDSGTEFWLLWNSQNALSVPAVPSIGLSSDSGAEFLALLEFAKWALRSSRPVNWLVIWFWSGILALLEFAKWALRSSCARHDYGADFLFFLFAKCALCSSNAIMILEQYYSAKCVFPFQLCPSLYSGADLFFFRIVPCALRSSGVRHDSGTDSLVFLIRSIHHPPEIHAGLCASQIVTSAPPSHLIYRSVMPPPPPHRPLILKNSYFRLPLYLVLFFKSSPHCVQCTFNCYTHIQKIPSNTKYFATEMSFANTLSTKSDTSKIP